MWDALGGVMPRKTAEPRSAAADATRGSPDDANPGRRRSAALFVPDTTSLRTLAVAAHECRGCDLYKTATQVVFGAGPKTARIMFSAAQSVLGPQFKLMQHRGEVLMSTLAPRVVATIHPSAVLRAPDSEGRRAAYEMLVADLTVVAKTIAKR